MIRFNSPHCASERVLLAVALALTVSTSARADYQSTVLADNPLAFYALNPGVDGTSTAPDLTDNGNDGDALGISAASGPSAYITNAANFSGESAIDLSVGSNPGLLNFSGPITLEVWAQPSSTSLFGDILAKGYDSSSYQEIVLRVNGPYGANYYGSSGSVGDNGGLQTTNWVYVVLSSDGTNCSLYENGALVARNRDTSGSVQFGDAWMIGNGSSAGNGRFFNGNISEVALYNYGLTATQVRAHYLVGMYGTTNVPAPRNLSWSANDNSGVWDVATSTNWINVDNSQPTVFDSGDSVLFDDTAGVPTSVTVNGVVSAGTLTVDTSANSYTISGSSLSVGSLIKEGSSTLTINSSTAISGAATINGGTVYAGNNSFNTASSITITNDSTLDLGGGNIPNNMPMTISGTGVNGAGAIYNSYADYPSESLNVTLAGDTKFGGSARWDLASGSAISGAHNLTVDWSAGAGYGQWNTMTIGSTVPEISVTNGSTLGMSYMDTSCQNPATLFSIGSGCQLVFYNGGFNGSIATAGQVVIYNGNITFSGSTIHVLSGGVVYLYAPGMTFSGSSLIFEDNSQWVSYYTSGANTIENAVTFNGVAHFVLGDHSMVYTGVASGSGGFVLDYYNNEVVFSASNTYTGPTIIGSSGNSPEVALTGDGSISQSSLIFFGGNSPTQAHLDVSGRSDQTLTLASGQTLAGIGGINGSLAVSPGAILSPSGSNTTIGITTGANSTGAIAASSAVTLNGTTVLKLDGSGVNDAVEAGAGITYGGILSLVNISGSPLAVGNSFQVFSAASYSGSFASITPATPGPGLAWDTSQLNIGVLNVAAAPSITSVAEVAGNLVFSGINGTANGTFYVLTTTNLLTPLTNWAILSTNSFNGSGGFSVTNAINPGTPKRFYLIESP